jgi:hypothetical protein
LSFNVKLRDSPGAMFSTSPTILPPFRISNSLTLSAPMLRTLNVTEPGFTVIGFGQPSLVSFTPTVCSFAAPAGVASTASATTAASAPRKSVRAGRIKPRARAWPAARASAS